MVASLYLMLIAPIMITGWNNTTFHADAAIMVTVLLLIGIGVILAISSLVMQRIR